MIIILSNNARAQSWEKIAMWVVASNLILLAAEEEEEKDMEHKHDKLRVAFNELLDVHLEMREKFGFGEFVQDYKYDWIDKAGLTDSY